MLFTFFLAIVAHAGLSRVDSVSTQDQIERGSHANCDAGDANDVVSVNIGFSYAKTPDIGLKQSPLNDTKFYQQLASGFTPKTKVATLFDSAAPPGSTKDQFLARLKGVVGSSKVVNLNYAGHGLLMPNGEFGLVLPSVSQEIIDKCFKPPSAQRRGLELVRIDPASDTSAKPPADASSSPTPKADQPKAADPCAGLDNYVVTTKDLKNVLGNRKVFGIIDACHAGSFDLGPRSSMLLASSASEEAHQDNEAGGAFTQSIKKQLGNVCGSDLDGDQQISMHELTVTMAGRAPTGQMVASRGLGRITPVFERNNQHPILTGRSWTDCYVPNNAGAEACTRKFHDGEFLETTSAADAADIASSKTCSLDAGTRVQALEDAGGTSGRMKVEVPSRCGFTEGRVPLTRLRNDGAFAPKPDRTGIDAGAGTSR